MIRVDSRGFFFGYRCLPPIGPHIDHHTMVARGLTLGVHDQLQLFARIQAADRGESNSLALDLVLQITFNRCRSQAIRELDL